MSKFVVQATWDDVPHLTAEAKAEYWKNTPPHQRECRSKGTPALGEGAVFPIEESAITVDDFEIPKHYPRAFSLDTGWKWTAAVWGALDRDADTVYLYSAYKRAEAEPPIHAAAIKARGVWIPGVGDAAAINNHDGQQMIHTYRKLGLDLKLPDKAVEAGIQEVWMRLSTGRLVIFKSLAGWLKEYRLYRRVKGKIVKENDHLMDATRYLIMSGLERMIVEPIKKTGRSMPPASAYS